MRTTTSGSISPSPHQRAGAFDRAQVEFHHPFVCLFVVRKPIRPALHSKRTGPQAGGGLVDQSRCFQAFTAGSRRAALADYLGSWGSRFDTFVHARRSSRIIPQDGGSGTRSSHPTGPRSRNGPIPLVGQAVGGREELSSSDISGAFLHWVWGLG